MYILNRYIPAVSPALRMDAQIIYISISICILYRYMCVDIEIVI